MKFDAILGISLAALYPNLEILSAPATGPLRVHPTNPRYFTDGTKQSDGLLKAVYVTGSHTWANLIDRGPSDPPPVFAGVEYLVYQPNGDEAFSVELNVGTYQFEWFDPIKGIIGKTGTLTSRGGQEQLQAPFDSDVVLYLKTKL